LAPIVAGYVRGKCSDAGIPSQDSDDLAQEVSVDVLCHLHAFRLERSGDNLSRWIRAITRAKVGDYFRTRARRAEGDAPGGPDVQFVQVAEPLRETGEIVLNNDSQARIFQSARTLVRARVLPQTWEAFCAFTVELRDAKEVAAKLHMTSHAVLEAVYRVRELLKECAALLAKARDDSA
jgi:DNA-directed RNA polymerase specialized sigma24 family protein